MRKTVQDLERKEIADLEEKKYYEIKYFNRMVAETHKKYQKVTKTKIRYPFKFKTCCKCGEEVKFETVFFIEGSALSKGFWLYNDLYGCKNCFHAADSFLQYAIMEHLIPNKYEYLCRQIDSKQVKISYMMDSEKNIKWKEMSEDLIRRREEMIRNKAE